MATNDTNNVVPILASLDPNDLVQVIPIRGAKPYIGAATDGPWYGKVGDFAGATGVSSITATTPIVASAPTGAITLSHANTAVTPGSYTNASLTVDAKGHVTAAANGTAPINTGGIEYVFDNNGQALATDTKGELIIPFACTITGARIITDLDVVTDPFILDIWKSSFAAYDALTNPDAADTICAAAPLTVAVGDSSATSALTGWTLSIAANDVLRFNIDQGDVPTRASILLAVNLI